MWTTTDYIKNLPDAWNKETESNNYKLLSLEQALVETLSRDVAAVQNALDINRASGKTLDLYGDMVGVKRGLARDEQYRYLILATVAKQFCDGTDASVAEQLAVALGCDVSEFQTEEGNGTVSFSRMPLESVLRAGLTTAQLNATVQALLPIGVKLETFELQGTFEFSASADEYDEAAGFADEAQTIGGKLGAMSDEDVKPA